ncbi:protein preY, mitochondrial-like isoform X2 [Mercenaria mercenaria]|uniref:protein preY, mitochondrial-like isoform X2 n=1 Tax=Mercenaria mercenaria TaxID=6596 RepID=UPI00234F5C24|nr:protein preY, mitochondrial-like isoform X2 [Mercenaria mercenaria]
MRITLDVSNISSLVKNLRLQQSTKTQCLFQQPGATLFVQKHKLFCSQTDQSSDNTNSQQFDERLLEVLVCPLSKQPLRYDKANNELVSESIGVAYPIKNGIPNLVPQDARTFEKPTEIDT